MDHSVPQNGEEASLSTDDGFPRQAMKIIGFTGKTHHDTYPAIDPTKLDLTGKAVLVTGANRGIGRAILISYAKAGASRLALQESVDAVAKVVDEKWGRLDTLINNAGFMAEDCDDLMTVASRDDWDRTLDVNFMGTVRVTRALLPIMLRGGERTVLNMSSIASMLCSGHMEAYCISKFAVCRVAEILCTSYASEGLLAYSLHPAGIDTPLARRMSPVFHQFLKDEEELPADTIVFLTSERRMWLAGRWVNCNWDMPALMAKEDEIVERDLLKFKCDGLF